MGYLISFRTPIMYFSSVQIFAISLISLIKESSAFPKELSSFLPLSCFEDYSGFPSFYR